MDKKYQDINIADKNDIYIKLLIPRGSHIISIFFDDDAVRIHYVNRDGMYDTTNIAYEQLTGGYKIVID